MWKTIVCLTPGTLVTFAMGNQKVKGRIGVVIKSDKMMRGKFKGEYEYTIYVRGQGLFSLKIHYYDLSKYFSSIRKVSFVSSPLYDEGKRYVKLREYKNQTKPPKGKNVDRRV